LCALKADALCTADADQLPPTLSISAFATFNSYSSQLLRNCHTFAPRSTQTFSCHTLGVCHKPIGRIANPDLQGGGRGQSDKLPKTSCGGGGRGFSGCLFFGICQRRRTPHRLALHNTVESPRLPGEWLSMGGSSSTHNSSKRTGGVGVCKPGSPIGYRGASILGVSPPLTKV
jgi:hypothetical protein